MLGEGVAVGSEVKRSIRAVTPRENLGHKNRAQDTPARTPAGTRGLQELGRTLPSPYPTSVWLLLGWVTAERSFPCKQPACPAVGGGSEVISKLLFPRLSVREDHNLAW
ncbi:hypothetical protein J6590_049246 [Homalodisca vitripennis]|nr:hypothetical protein J6590_049246 [Homalodisca vitripennis]